MKSCLSIINRISIKSELKLKQLEKKTYRARQTWTNWLKFITIRLIEREWQKFNWIFRNCKIFLKIYQIFSHFMHRHVPHIKKQNLLICFVLAAIKSSLTFHCWSVLCSTNNSSLINASRSRLLHVADNLSTDDKRDAFEFMAIHCEFDNLWCLCGDKFQFLWARGCLTRGIT